MITKAETPTSPKTRLRELIDSIHAGTFILPNGEQLAPIPKTVEEVTGTRPAPTQCVRYTCRPIDGIVLPSLSVGGKKLTTPSWVRLWIAASSFNRFPSQKAMTNKPQKVGRKPFPRPEKTNKTQASMVPTTNTIDQQLDAAGL